MLENTGLFISRAILSKQLNVLKLVQLINTASEAVFWPRVIAASIVDLSEIRATFSSFPSPKVPKDSVLKPLISKAFRRGVLTSSMYGESKANFLTPICFAYSVAAKRGFVTFLVLLPD